MSRIGKMPIAIPQGVDVEIDANAVKVKGPKGTLHRDMHKEMIIKHEDAQIIVERPSDSKSHRGLHGLTRTLISNMVEGVTKGFEKKLALEGVGYRAALSGTKLVLTVGYSHPVEFEPPEGISFEVPAPNRISIKGFDKELVGQVAANIRKVREPEPYKGKGIRYEDEVVRRKEGKTGSK